MYAQRTNDALYLAYHWLSSGGRLQYHTQIEDKACRSHQAVTTAKEVRSRSCKKGSKECARREDRHDERVLSGRDFGTSVRGEVALPIGHCENTANGSGAVVEGISAVFRWMLVL